VNAYGVERRVAPLGERGWTFYSRNGMIAMNAQAASSVGLASLNSTITDGIRLDIDETFDKSYLYGALGFFGSGGLALAGDMGSIGPTFSQNVTSMSGRPNLVFCFGQAAYSSSPTWQNGALSSVGWAVDGISGIQNCGCFWWNKQAANPTEVAARSSATYCTAKLNSGSTGLGQGYISAFLSNGFTVRNADLDVLIPGIGYLALGLPNVALWAGHITTPATNGAASFTNLGRRPQAWIVGQNLVTSADTTDTGDTSSCMGIGMAAGRGTVTSYSAAVRERDKVTTYEAGAVASANIAHLYNANGADGILASSASMDASGVSANFTETIIDNTLWPSLMIGDGRSLVVPKRRAHKPLIGR